MTTLARRALAGLMLLPFGDPAGLILRPTGALAQAPARRGPHGGRVVIAEGRPIEILVAGTDLTLFLNDATGRPASSAQATSRVTLQSGALLATLSLVPAEPNRMVGSFTVAPIPGARLIVTGRMGDGHEFTLRTVLE